MKKEYGSVRQFVLAHHDAILNELNKGRTVRAICRDMNEKYGLNISYTSFLYNVNSRITGNISIDHYLKRVTENKKDLPKSVAQPVVQQKFIYSTEYNEEDMI